MLSNSSTDGWELIVMSDAIVCAFGVTMSLTLAFATNSASAQMTPDGTLPTNSSVIREGNNFNITGGTQAGGNLFHSFVEFSVPTGSTAIFHNSTDIQNIINRVTGGSVSNIDGLIRASGNANLFLINPNGIIFGRNAELDIGGSFLASTASSLKFADAREFSAKTPQTTPLLTISTPIGLQFEGNPGSIKVQGIGGFLGYIQQRGLIVPKDKTLALVGGNLTLENAFLQAPRGRVELGSVTGNGLVTLNSLDKGWALNYQGVQNLGNIQISRSFVDIANEDNSNINVLGDKGAISLRASLLEIRGTSIVRADTFTSAPGGDVNIDAQRLTVREGSQVLTRTLDAGSGGNLTVNASESVEIAGTSPGGSFASGLSTGVDDKEAIGNGGNLTIITKQLIVKDRGGVSTSTGGIGKAGDLIIRAADRVELSKGGLLSTASAPQATGNGGNLTIETGKLSVHTQTGIPTQIITGTYGQGNAGNLFIRAFDTVTVSGRGSLISTQVGPQTPGKGGNLTIETPSLKIENLAQIGTGTLGSGHAGNLLVKATEFVQLSDSSLTTQSENSGNAGNLTIETGELIVSDGAQVATGTKDGQAGTLTVTASKSVELRGVSPKDSGIPSGLFAATNGVGDAGSLEIKTTRLVIRDGARVVVSTIGSGRGGTLAVNAKESIEVSGSSIDSQSALFAETLSTGNAGSIKIETGKLTLQDGGLVSAATRSQGQGGSIVVNASEIGIYGSSASGFTSGILTSTSGSGKGGDITLTTSNLLVSNNSTIDARTSGDGEGGSIRVWADSLEATRGGRLLTTTEGSKSAGDITVNARNKMILVEPGSGLFANTSIGSSGQGGGVTIQVGDLFVRDGAFVNVSSFGSGNAGSLTVNAKSIGLDNQGKLQAATASGEGGNINLQVRDLILMRRNSLISAKADNNGNGGSLKINATFIVAVPSEDSNIIANAFGGRGGNINIITNGIYGLQYRPSLTEFSDINASSQFGINGTVQINTPDIDPSRNLVDLPVNVVDATQQIATDCSFDRKQRRGSLTATGRGGLPSAPTEPLTGDAVLANWVKLPSEVGRKGDGDRVSLGENNTNTPNFPTQIVEASGWVMDTNGDIVLVGGAPTATPTSPTYRSASCQAS
ncbi:hypothetical protein WA1_26015 [Scytonema hofmannii PCC 7110]|uniref:Filamentous haemagglutinin FhaB/tRNA nuclease CdiA-like TPS domain-containing protein n=1 Tax=Scytonema hofmannii PCC 7110 TaxID=128403 RepID=A0A139X7A5_9CYAN|nr:filamentous hemagglutinin N-terminal domain-containing protein [Scytonema hofmannii]KYC40577.1 hypothetical protein WA1_26015 [Scytonema hofmannii PCC 7110]